MSKSKISSIFPKLTDNVLSMKPISGIRPISSKNIEKHENIKYKVSSKMPSLSEELNTSM